MKSSLLAICFLTATLQVAPAQPDSPAAKAEEEIITLSNAWKLGSLSFPKLGG